MIDAKSTTVLIAVTVSFFMLFEFAVITQKQCRTPISLPVFNIFFYNYL